MIVCSEIRSRGAGAGAGSGGYGEDSCRGAPRRGRWRNGDYGAAVYPSGGKVLLNGWWDEWLGIVVSWEDGSNR